MTEDGRRGVRLAMHRGKDVIMTKDRTQGGKISVEASRKALFQDLKKKCKGQTISRNIPFINNDVPEYLKILANLEERSKRSSIVVK